ncbi:MAG TPA: flagellar hook protein FlgE [Bryobacteraceae bacterium]|nr:flagellar hook protein FlgE [Bryobacteraceae bacterium]
MLTAFSTALSALSADSTAISVVGNNLANLNTTGFKASTINFQDLLYETLGGGSSQVGMGVQQPTTDRVFSQGATQSSSNALDVAISGQGFLIVKTSAGATEYTRDGNLTTDAQGDLETSNGDYVQGWSSLTGNVNATGPTGNITVPSGSLRQATPTANMSVTMNLDATAANTTPSTGGVANPPTFSTPIEVYDSLGNSHVVTLDFWKTASASGGTPAQWTWAASVPSTDGTTTSTGTLQFDQNGNLVSPSATAAAPTVTITGLTDGASDLTINWNLYTNGSSTLTQYAQSSSMSNNSQDGSAPAQMTDISIGNGGVVLAQLSNGQQMEVGQLAMANFVNPDSLLDVGNNNYQVSGATSNAAVGTPDSGGRGEILGSSLESSTVDISTEFTNLMTYQNSYEAASRVITTADTIMQQTLNIMSPNG